MKKWFVCVLAFFMLVFMSTTNGFSMMHKIPKKKAIVLAMFGTAYPCAIHSLVNIQRHIQKAFPHTPVKIAFTSNIIRMIWEKRAKDPKWQHNPEVPKEVLYVKSLLGEIGDLQNEGYTQIVVQPTHFYAGEEFCDVLSYVHGLNDIHTIKKEWMPFTKPIVVGRPLTGMWGVRYPYRKDMKILARALKPEVEIARKNHAALVYMGHGNEYYSTGIYAEFQEVMQKMYPDVKIIIGTVEGFPSLQDAVTWAKMAHVKKVVMFPLMIVAGDHAHNDMAGNAPDSWKNTFERNGIKVIPEFVGLGDLNGVAKIFVEHIRDAARDGGIKLD